MRCPPVLERKMADCDVTNTSMAETCVCVCFEGTEYDVTTTGRTETWGGGIYVVTNTSMAETSGGGV